MANQNSSLTYTYSNGKNQRDGLTYDAAGNLANDTAYSYNYNAQGQQATATGGGYSLTQNYDGNGLRAFKTENGATTYYLRSTVLGGAVVAEIDGNGGWQRGYVYANGELIAVQQNWQINWVHADPVTKSQRTTDVYGNPVSTVELEPRGANTNRSSNSAFQPQNFGSYIRDGNGDQDAMARRYDLSTSRFSQPDPYSGSYSFSNPQSLNRYAYTQNDPVNFRDPTGLLAYWSPEPTWTVTVYAGPTAIDDFFMRSILGSLFGSRPIMREPAGVLAREHRSRPEPQNTSDDHEFAHSRVRCPPSAEQLRNNPTVKKALNETLRRAQDRNIENGGWIFWNPATGRLLPFIKEPATSPPLPRDYPYTDTYYRVWLNNPPGAPKGMVVIAQFHAHLEAWGPTPDWDDAAADQNKIPGLLVDSKKTYTYGHYTRGIWNTDLPSRCR